VPAAAGRVLARLHAPETLGLDRPTGQAATATDPAR
jgi:hypothetical protein